MVTGEGLTSRRVGKQKERPDSAVYFRQGSRGKAIPHKSKIGAMFSSKDFSSFQQIKNSVSGIVKNENRR